MAGIVTCAPDRIDSQLLAGETAFLGNYSTGYIFVDGEFVLDPG